MSGGENREENMASVLSTVQSISLGLTSRPGFFLGQSDSSPALTLVLETRRLLRRA